MRRKKFLLFIALIGLVGFLTTGLEARPAEEVTIVNGTGADIEKSASQIIYKVHRAIYVFYQDNKIANRILSGSGTTISETRQDRHTTSNQRDVQGQEKVFLFSDEYARSGLKPSLNLLYKNPSINNVSYIVICKGKTLPYLKHKIPGYPSSSDFIEGLIKNSSDYNFFSDNYNVVDLYVRSSSEGRTTALPYLELKEKSEKPNEKELKITGTALLKEDKMLSYINLEDSRMMNLLRENNVKGILTIQETPRNYIEYYGKSKRKVKCTKEGDKYNFIINLDIKGDIVSNELYKNILNDLSQRKDFEEKLALKVEEMCNDFLDKMRKEYKIDCLELGRVAAAKYGRRTGVDWDEIITKSNIKVNVKVKVDKQGRGDY